MTKIRGALIRRSLTAAAAGAVGLAVVSMPAAASETTSPERAATVDPASVTTMASCFDPAHPAWICRVDCNSTWAAVTFRHKNDGRQAAGTRIYFDSGNVYAYNSVARRYLPQTIHGIADRTAGNKKIWPANSDGWRALSPGQTRRGAAAPPKKGHVLRLLAGVHGDPAEARCKVR